MKATDSGGRIALVAALLCFAALAATFQIYDHDVGFHLKTGEWIALNHRLPTTDPFSFTRAGAPWPLQQGISAWVLWRIYDAGGVEGLIAMKAALVALIFGVVLWISWRECDSLTLAAAVSALGILAGRYRFYERPMLISTLLLVLVWACLTVHRRRGGVAPLAAVVLLLALWANLHAGWVQGMLLLGVFAGAGTLSAFLNFTGPRSAGVAERLRSAAGPWLAWLFAFGLSVGSLAIFHPRGAEVLLVPLTMARSAWFRAHVSEFTPLPFDNFHAVWVLIVLTAGALLLALIRGRLRLVDAAVFALFAGSALAVNRNMLPLAVIAPPILARHARGLIAEGWAEGWRGEAGHLIRRLAAPALVIGMACVAWFGFLEGERFRFGFGIDGRSTPLGAFRFIDENRLPGEVWNEDAWGGAFLWHFWPRRRDFVDNRLGVFNEAFFREIYIPVRDGEEGWEAVLDCYGVNTLLMEMAEKPIGIQGRAFQSPRWALLYWDDTSMVYVRRSAARKELLQRFEYRVVDPTDLLARLNAPATRPQAIVELERAVDESGRSWRSLNGLGVAYGMAGRYADASALFHEALALYPRITATLANLAVAERRLGGKAEEE